MNSQKERTIRIHIQPGTLESPRASSDLSESKPTPTMYQKPRSKAVAQRGLEKAGTRATKTLSSSEIVKLGKASRSGSRTISLPPKAGGSAESATAAAKAPSKGNHKRKRRCSGKSGTEQVNSAGVSSSVSRAFPSTCATPI